MIGRINSVPFRTANWFKFLYLRNLVSHELNTATKIGIKPQSNSHINVSKVRKVMVYFSKFLHLALDFYFGDFMNLSGTNSNSALDLMSSYRELSNV